MKTLAIFLISFFFVAGFCLAQTLPMPGGVSNPLLWGMAEKSGNANVFRIRKTGIEQVFPLGNNTPTLFNFNPTLNFNGTENPLSLSLGSMDLDKMTVFTVLYPADSVTEKSVWYFEKNSGTKLLLTTHRAADLADFRFMNFLDACKGCPLISAYTQHKQNDEIPLVGQNLVLGAAPVLPDLPIQPYRGLLAELIIFDRVLSPEERAQIESYLAIKYGISLSGGTLVDSKGKTIRDGKKYAGFAYRIAGIGRDNAAGLLQKQSASSYDPSLLSIGAGVIAPSNAANQAILNDLSFLIWGDDNAALRLLPKEMGKPQLLGRRWVMTAKGDVQEIATLLRFDTRRTDAELKPGEIWWLAIDRSGSGKFSMGDIDYFPMHDLSAAKIAKFKDVNWDSEHSGSDLFTLGVGPAMMSKFWVSQPLCSQEKSGILHIGAEGGRPPYSFEIKGLGSDFQKKWTAEDHQLRDLDGIGPGDYLLVTRDATGNVSYDSIFVQAADAPVSKLASQYLLMPGHTIRLDASTGMSDGISYEWLGPQEFSSHQPRIDIAKAGTYRLNLELAGCASRQDILVEGFMADNFKVVELFPNPAHEGRFQMVIGLHRTSKVEVHIADASGRALMQQTLDGSDRYVPAFHLQAASGAYVVTLISEGYSRSFPLVVE